MAKGLSMKRVLVADDEALVRDALSILLRTAGYEVICVSDGAQAVESFKARDADLVITDIVMPNQEGIETIQVLRKLKPDLPIIAISGGGRVSPTGYLQIAKTLGASVTLSKPLKPVELLRVVAELLA